MVKEAAAAADLLHAVETLLKQLDLNIWSGGVARRSFVVPPTVPNLLFPQELHLIPVGVQLPTQGVVLLLQTLFVHACRGTNSCYDNRQEQELPTGSNMVRSPALILLQGLSSQSSSDISISSSRLMPMISSL